MAPARKKELEAIESSGRLGLFLEAFVMQRSVIKLAREQNRTLQIESPEPWSRYEYHRRIESNGPN